jgi:hypothetical protein
MTRLVTRVADRLLTVVLPNKTALACTPFCQCAHFNGCCGYRCVNFQCHIIFYGCGSNGCTGC